MIARIDSAEREQTQVAARFEGGLQEVKNETLGLAQRMRRMEDDAAGPRSAEALRALIDRKVVGKAVIEMTTAHVPTVTSTLP